MIFHVVLEPAEDGWIVAGCPALPGCVSQGRDEKEALENIKEAITAGWQRKIRKRSKRFLQIGRQSSSQFEAANLFPNFCLLNCAVKSTTR